MSLAFRISVSESESRVIVVEDSVCSGLELLEILPREQMTGMLAAELERRGFTTKDGVVTREQDGVSVSVDLEKGVVSVRLSNEQEVEVTRDRSARTAAPPGAQGAAKEELRQQLKADIERAMAKEREGLREEVTARLEKLLPELRRVIDDAVNKVTADALKIRASQLGEIEEITEEADGSLTIKVRT